MLIKALPVYWGGEQKSLIYNKNIGIKINQQHNQIMVITIKIICCPLSTRLDVAV